MPKITKAAAGPLAAGFAALVLWIAIKAIWPVPDYILPGPLTVAAALLNERHVLVPAAATTLKGAFCGFLLAAGIGFPTALVIVSSRLAHRAIRPWLYILQMMPIMVTGPVIVIWVQSVLPTGLDTSLVGMALITFLMVYFPIVLSGVQGMVSTDQNLIDLFQMMGASRWQELIYLRLPWALPHFFTGLKVAASLSVISALVGELFAGSPSNGNGLYYQVLSYKTQLRTPELFAAAIVACCLGFCFVGIVALSRWFFLRHWHISAIDKEAH